MPTYAEMVKKARELHGRLGERKFREFYENRPSALMDALTGGKVMPRRKEMGREVLQAFRFYPLPPSEAGVRSSILEHYGKQHIDSGLLTALGHKPRVASGTLRILEARGDIRLARIKGKLIVTEVFDGNSWKKAVLPGEKR